MPLITINSGGDIPEGVYPVILAGIEGPKKITARQGPNAGEEFEIFSWKFVILDGKYKDTEIEATTSTATGPRSKLYGFLTALYNGTPPKVNTTATGAPVSGPASAPAPTPAGVVTPLREQVAAGSGELPF
jgi:hypothetical protein